MSPYRALLRTPGSLRAEVFSLLGRLGYVMCGLGSLFLGTDRMGITAGGLGAGAFALGAAVGTPLSGRLSAQYGTPRVFSLLAATSVLGTLTALLSTTGYSLPGFALGCVIIGATAPPVGAGMRALWAKADIAEHLRGPANSLESVGMEVLFILGPPLVGLLATADPVLTLVVADGCVLVGAIGFATAPLVRRLLGPTTDRSGGPSRRVLSRPVVWLLCVAGLTAAASGAMDVAVVAALRESGSAQSAGLVLLAPAVGSVLGGIGYGLVSTERTPGRRLGLLLLAWMCTLILVAIQTTPWPLALALFLSGIPMAALGVEEFNLLGRANPDPRRIQEVYSWAGSSINVGVSTGSAVCGFVAAHSPQGLALWTPAAAVLVACLPYTVARSSWRRSVSNNSDTATEVLR